MAPHGPVLVHRAAELFPAPSQSPVRPEGGARSGTLDGAFRCPGVKPGSYLAAAREGATGAGVGAGTRRSPHPAGTAA